MIELEQLQHLLAFHEHKTLSLAAKELHISQPVLTRSMQKLEDELEVSLFNRTKNKISFNETGKLAVELAQKIIEETNDMKNKIKAFDKSQHTFSIGSCAPAPNTYFTQKVTQFYPDKTILSEIQDMDSLIEGIKEKTYTVIIMPYEIEDENIDKQTDSCN